MKTMGHLLNTQFSDLNIWWIYLPCISSESYNWFPISYRDIYQCSWVFIWGNHSNIDAPHRSQDAVIDIDCRNEWRKGIFRFGNLGNIYLHHSLGEFSFPQVFNLKIYQQIHFVEQFHRFVKYFFWYSWNWIHTIYLEYLYHHIYPIIKR